MKQGDIYARRSDGCAVRVEEADDYPMGFACLCPVSLVDGRWVRDSTRHRSRKRVHLAERELRLVLQADEEVTRWRR